jgi:hypothetical protein
VVCKWRWQQLIDSGQLPGETSSDHSELAIHRKAAEFFGDAVPPKKTL